MSRVRAGVALCTSLAYGADRTLKNEPTEKMNYIVKKRLRFMMVKEASEEKLNSPKKVYEFMRGEAEIDRECVGAPPEYQTQADRKRVSEHGHY